MGLNMKRFLLLVPAAVLAACAPDASTPAESPAAAAPALNPSEAMHQGFMVLDSHLDTPANFHSEEYTFSKRGNFEEDGTQVDQIGRASCRERV